MTPSGKITRLARTLTVQAKRSALLLPSILI
nr:MAG TPA: hypothetical protein [Caudoviricetes sp.]